MTFELAGEQRAAVKAVQSFLASDRQVFRLFGYAGTGKTTIAKELVKNFGGTVRFAAFTGKAAHVLTSKGVPAVTLHSLLYKPKSASRQRLLALNTLLKQTTDEKKREQLKIQIREEEDNVSRPLFALNEESPLKNTDLLVIDEVSMVNRQMAEDILSFDCKVLVLGDPAQLPPVMGEGFFINAEPDFMLETIHRQAEDNPIIMLSQRIRKGESVGYGVYGDSTVIRKNELNPNIVLGVDQVIVGRNKTRTAYNSRIRELLGRGDGPRPVKDDKLVCLSNNSDNGLINGSLWTVYHVEENPDYDTRVDLSLVGEDGAQVITTAHDAYFRNEKPDFYEIKEADAFTFGYTMTCHKAQGSQWPSVLVVREAFGGAADRRKWLYTAVTRASKRLVLVA